MRRIRLGEDTALELKAVRFRGREVMEPKRAELADEIAAMANTADGAVVLGVSDDREIDGLTPEELDRVERAVYEICTDTIRPPVVFRTSRLELPDPEGELRAVPQVEIPRSLFVHQSRGGYFHRQGSSERPRAPEESARLFHQRSQARLIRFAELARTHSVDPSAGDGGELALPRPSLSRRLGIDGLRAVLHLQPGERSRWVQDDERSRFLLVELRGVEPPRPSTFDQARQRARRLLGQRRAEKLVEEITAEWWQRLDVRSSEEPTLGPETDP